MQGTAHTLLRQALDQLSDAELRAPLAARYEHLIERVRARRSERDDAEAPELLADLLELGLRLLQGLGSQAVAALRSDVDLQLQELLREETATAELLRRFALKQLERSVEVFASLVELYGSLLHGLPPEAMADLMDEVRAFFPGDPSGAPSSHALAHWLLALTMGLESIHDDLDELTFWAREAAESSRRVELMLGQLSSVVLGLRARVEARWSWASWTDEDIERERSSWKHLVE
jgi:hypothetical protein